ncbi:MAG: helix-turn-helix domain-containing protein [Halorubrum sp.]
MRELVFTIEYDPGRNAVADVLADHPGTRVRSLSLHATRESLWRVDHTMGTPEALDAIEATFRTADYYADCLANEACGATQTTRVLEHSDDTLVLYSYWERTPTCVSVPHIAFDHLGEGLLFETRHEGRQYRWRVIHTGAGSSDVRGFLDAVADAVGDGADMQLRRLRDADSATTSGVEASGAGSYGPSTAVDRENALPTEQATALRAAVKHGYYETPRAVDAAELAERLGVARSTLTYRLRRAEAHLAERHVERNAPLDGAFTSD